MFSLNSGGVTEHRLVLAYRGPHLISSVKFKKLNSKRKIYFNVWCDIMQGSSEQAKELPPIQIP